MLILAILMSSLSNVTAQDRSLPKNPIFTDSLFCLPVKYFMFIMDDLKKGDHGIVKAQEFQEKVLAQGEENTRLKKELDMVKEERSLEKEDCFLCRDSLERKNALITNLHMENHKIKNGKTLGWAAAGLMALLFLLK